MSIFPLRVGRLVNRAVGRQNPQFIHYAKYAMPPSAKANIIISSSAWKKSIGQETNAHFQVGFPIESKTVKKNTTQGFPINSKISIFLKDFLEGRKKRLDGVL